MICRNSAAYFFFNWKLNHIY
uniref:Uncharacterized protein n=1 Tax=Anguilla anguilla TaxID=7936 RepID=A0A0E9PKW3_ANGAN